MIKAVLSKIKKEVSIFFLTISWKKMLTFFIFILIATILWFMQIYNKEFETTVSIPIKYTSIPDSIIIQNTLPDRINIRLKDDGIAMFGYRYFRKDTLNINVGSLLKTTNGNTSRITIQGAILEQYIRNTLSEKSQILNYTPLTITVSYAPLSKKILPVIFDGIVDIPPGYLLTKDISLNPDSVIVYGAEKDLNKLLYVYTDVDTIHDVESDREILVDLRSIPKVKTNVDKIKLSLEVEAYIQKTINIPVECVNLPDNEVVKFFPSKVKILFFCGVSQLEQINSDDFKVIVDYQSLKESSSSTVPVRITNTPDYAHNITIVPANVEFIFGHK